MSDKQKEPPELLDFEQFESIDDAVEKVEAAGRRYREIGKLAFERDHDLTLLKMFFLSVVARAQGLHDAIAREIRNSNPYAVFPTPRDEPTPFGTQGPLRTWPGG